MKRAGMEQNKVTNREGFLCRNLAAVLVAAAMLLLIPAAAQAAADDYYWDEQTVKEWQENSAKGSEKEEQGFDGYTEEVWSYSEKELTESENPSGENEAGGSQAVATGFISEVSLIETEPVVRSSGNLNPFNLEGVEVHPVLDELPGLDDATFDDKYDPDRFESNRGFDLFDPGTWVSGQGFNPFRSDQGFDLFDPGTWVSGQGFNPFRSGQGFDLFDPSSWGSGNNTGDSYDETEGPFWFGLDETIMSGGSTDSRNPDPGNCIQYTGSGRVWTCRHHEEDQPEYYEYHVEYDEDGNQHLYYRDGSPMFPEEESNNGKSGSDPADVEIKQSVPVIVPCSEGPIGCGDDPADDEKVNDDEKDEKGCAIDPTMDGGGNSGQGSLVNGPPADYDPLTDGLHGLTPEYDPRLPNDGRRDIDGTIDPSKTPGYGLTPERDPRLPNDGCGDLGGKIDPSKAPGYGLTPERDPRLPDDGNTPDSPLSFSQGKAPVFPGSLFGKELELNAETVEK